MKHTPPPWDVRPAESPWERTAIKAGSVTVGFIDTSDDARLIAAAPEMLAALKAVAIIRNGWPEVFDQVDAAIVKAGGRA